MYTIVFWILAWPNRSCTNATSAPVSRRCTAIACRKAWKRRLGFGMAATWPYFCIKSQYDRRSKGMPRVEINRYGESSSRVRRQVCRHRRVFRLHHIGPPAANSGKFKVRLLHAMSQPLHVDFFHRQLAKMAVVLVPQTGIIEICNPITGGFFPLQESVFHSLLLVPGFFSEIYLDPTHSGYQYTHP